MPFVIAETVREHCAKCRPEASSSTTSSATRLPPRPPRRVEGREHPDDYDTTVSTLQDLVEDAVTRQLVADVPVSSILSGGLDSTAISGIAAQHLRGRAGTALPTFCVESDTHADHFVPTALRPALA